MNRRKRREKLMALFYEMDIRKDYILYKREEDLDEYQLNVIELWLLHREEIDEKLNKNLKNWSINTLGKVELAMLRVAITEILYTDIPNPVSINEAIDIVKEYSEEKSGGLVNAILKTFI